MFDAFLVYRLSSIGHFHERQRSARKGRLFTLTLALSRFYTASMADAAKKCAKQRFMEFLTQKNLRVTAQRQAIIDTAFSTDKHFTAEQLLEWSRRKDKSVSRATVYRTLPLLTESGLVREMDFGKDYKFYDPNYAEHPHHNHIICQDCEKIVEFESEKIERLENEISQRLGFSVKAHRLQITATCEELKKLGACRKKRG
jgi:Fur family ferric uptake transcriptional regulator